MTKEELIALSDLNREDNIKYISSEAQGIAITLDSDRYAPTFCKLERAYICGRRKSEEQIEELEKENAELNKLRCCENCKNVNLQLHWRESEEVDKRRQFVCGTCGNRKHWEYLGKTVGITETQQLTKAKDLLRDFLSVAIDYIDKEDKNYSLITEAEQFLKDQEEEPCGQ